MVRGYRKTHTRRIIVKWGSVLGLVALVIGMLSVSASAAKPPFWPLFDNTWARTDMPVADGIVSRTWIWGPAANTLAMTEPYAESPGGQRTVQYYDKSRMEVTHPMADPGSIWYVTNGLLVVEMITGQMQVGDASFIPQSPAAINVAGDASDPDGPTYATFGPLLTAPPAMVGSTITDRVDRDSNVTDDPSLAAEGITVAIVDGVTDHAIAEPFWTFMNSSGTVYENGSFVTENLFENPYFATGRPVTEAYWADVLVGGIEKLVLMQCFERRCLTYTPSNTLEWQVEAGNVGQHYFTWRYGNPPPSDEIDLYFSNLGDWGATGLFFGCGDSLVGVDSGLSESTDTLEDALMALFAINTETYMGYDNALANNTIVINQATVVGGVATVELSGQIPIAGVCDEPRIIKQIEETVLQFNSVESAEISLNGSPLEGLNQ